MFLVGGLVLVVSGLVVLLAVLMLLVGNEELLATLLLVGTTICGISKKLNFARFAPLHL